MEFVLLIVSVMIYFWIVIPVVKKKIGFSKLGSEKLFYSYKTMWHPFYELAVILVMIAGIVMLTPSFGNATFFFVPLAFAAIFIVRGILEKKYFPSDRHHIISFLHAAAIVASFTAVGIYAVIMA